MLKIQEDASCEHCGDLEPFEAMWDNDLCFWCLDCARMDYDFTHSQEEIDVAIIESMNRKIEHFHNRIMECSHRKAEINNRRNINGK
jgi:hypothetical protein